MLLLSNSIPFWNFSNSLFLELLPVSKSQTTFRIVAAFIRKVEIGRLQYLKQFFAAALIDALLRLWRY